MGRKPSIDEPTQIACEADYVIEGLCIEKIAAKRRLSESALCRLSIKLGWVKKRAEFEAKSKQTTAIAMVAQAAQDVGNEAARVVISQKRMLDNALKMIGYYGQFDEQTGRPVLETALMTMDGAIKVPMLGDSAKLRAWVAALKDAIATQRVVWGLDAESKGDGPRLVDAHAKMIEREQSGPPVWED